MKNYETVFIVDPTLSVSKAKKAVEKFVNILAEGKAEIINTEQWGVKSMAYAINKKTTGFYNLIEFKAESAVIKTFETELQRDESVMRFLTVALEKEAVLYNERRRNGEFNKQDKESTAQKKTTQ